MCNQEAEKLLQSCYTTALIDIASHQTDHTGKWYKPAMGKVRPFCPSGLVACILWPFCGLQYKKFCEQSLQYPCQHLPKRASHADMSDSMKQIENNNYSSPGTHCNLVLQMMKAPDLVYVQHNVRPKDACMPIQSSIPG